VALRVHLDTNVYAAFMRGRREAVFAIDHVPGLAMSPVVLGELKAGFALGSRTGENLRELERFLDSPRVAIPAIDDRVTDNYARIYRQLRAEGTPIPSNDLWIAACVDVQDALFTYDVHFERVSGLRVLRNERDVQLFLGR
jgi:tRNA(fMet)-specific endonuclease VapC